MDYCDILKKGNNARHTLPKDRRAKRDYTVGYRSGCDKQVIQGFDLTMEECE